MGLVLRLLWLFTGFLQGVHGQGVYGKDVINTHTLHAVNLHICVNVSVRV